MMLWKCCIQYASKCGNLNSGYRNGKDKLSFQIPKKGNAKECSNYHTIALNSPLQSNSQNSPSQASTICVPWTSRCSSWIQKRQWNQRSSWQHLLDHWKSKKVSEKYLLLLYQLCQIFDCVNQNKLWIILKEMGIPDHLTCLLRNLYAGQEATELVMEKQTGSK